MRDAHGSPRRTDGTSVHGAGPSIWPAGVALALTLLTLGLVVHLLFAAAGAVLLALSLWNWGGELRHG
jgi:hypothetical protein